MSCQKLLLLEPFEYDESANNDRSSTPPLVFTEDEWDDTPVTSPSTAIASENDPNSLFADLDLVEVSFIPPPPPPPQKSFVDESATNILSMLLSQFDASDSQYLVHQ
ncbi:hypothetical protein LRAMOSA05097 [Lichtheimia ramosa]|uniref:Uncharacterized protein n=1 Tax=Lichtheimia ramosa TaxID=688394 RepID=A0A077X117_9FUNG|nr:hypothetical protein LRAMOSA05097 [Lichtheimia ramosa]